MTAPYTPSREELLALLSNGLRAADSLNRALIAHMARRFPNDVPSAAVEKAMSEWEAARANLPSYDECQRLAAKPAEDGVREATIEECAKIAADYGDVPCSGPHNNTLEAFNHGMNHLAGCVDSACCIEEAIRALSPKAKP